MAYLNLFFSWFSSSKLDDKELPWIDLNRLDQLDSIIKESNGRIMIIFKHSTRCGISRMVLKDFIRKYALNEESAKLFYLDIFSYRELSNELSIRFGIVHESPQIIVIKDGEVIHHASHYMIDAEKLNEFGSIDA